MVRSPSRRHRRRRILVTSAPPPVTCGYHPTKEETRRQATGDLRSSSPLIEECTSDSAHRTFWPSSNEPLASLPREPESTHAPAPAAGLRRCCGEPPSKFERSARGVRRPGLGWEPAAEPCAKGEPHANADVGAQGENSAACDFAEPSPPWGGSAEGAAGGGCATARTMGFSPRLAAARAAARKPRSAPERGVRRLRGVSGSVLGGVAGKISRPIDVVLAAAAAAEGCFGGGGKFSAAEGGCSLCRAGATSSSCGRSLASKAAAAAAVTAAAAISAVLEPGLRSPAGGTIAVPLATS